MFVFSLKLSLWNERLLESEFFASHKIEQFGTCAQISKIEKKML